MIHDAARPFLPRRVIDRLLGALETHDGAVPALPLADTLARDATAKPCRRDGLVRVQTPQAFRYDAIRRAHAQWTGDEATDDAQIARAAGLSVALVEGDPALEKLTYEADFRRAEAGLLVPRVGFGFDVHAFAAGEELWLGGLQIPHDKGLAGHSDADVVLHAITDAILGALGAGDIGDHFPPSDPQWRGAASSLLRRACRARWSSKRADGSRMSTSRSSARRRRSARIGTRCGRGSPRCCGCRLTRISVKATTTERLGFAGRGEGIAAQAVATVLMGDIE